MPQAFKGKGTSIFGGEMTDFKGVQPLIDKHRHNRVLSVIGTDQFRAIAAQSLRKAASETIFSEMRLIANKTVKLAAANGAESNAAILGELRAMKIAIAALGEKNRVRKERTATQLATLNESTPQESFIRINAESAAAVAVDHYFHNITASMNIIADLGLRRNGEKPAMLESHLKILKNELGKFNTDLEFMECVQPSGILSTFYLEKSDISMVLFPTDPEYAAKLANKTV